MVESKTDRALWELSREGDSEAFIELVGRYQAAVCAVTFAVTRNPASSEDLAQETFLAAWRNLDSVRNPERLSAWLCTIARNLARKALRRPRPSLSVDGDVLPADSMTPEEVLVAHEEASVVWAALGELPVRYREPLILYYREGWSARRVAESLGLSAATVDQRLSRGRKMLRADLTRQLEQTLPATQPGDRVRRRVAAVLPLLPGVPTGPEPSMVTSTIVGGLAVKKLFVIVTVLAVVVFGLIYAQVDDDRAPVARASPTVEASDGVSWERVRGESDLRDARERAKAGEVSKPSVRPAGHAYELSARGNRVTVNLDGGPSRMVIFGSSDPKVSGLITIAPEEGADPTTVAAHEDTVRTAEAAFAGVEPDALRTIEGRVVTRDGQPAIGVVVLAGHLAFHRGHPESYAEAEAGVKADASGRFTLEVDAAEPCSVVAMGPAGWSDLVRVPAGSEAASIELRMGAEQRLTGRTLRSGEGHPAHVRLYDVSTKVGYEVSSDLDGRFEVDPIAPGTYRVSAAAESGNEAPRTRAAELEVVVAKGHDASVELELPEGGLLVARVNLPKEVSEGSMISRLFTGHETYPTSEAMNASLAQNPAITELFETGDRTVLEEDVEFADLDPGDYTVCVELMTPAKPVETPQGVALSIEMLGFGCQPLTLSPNQDLTEVEVPLTPT